MSINNLKTLLGQLKSDKLKERQQGIASLREVFSRDSAVERLDEIGDGRAWLVVFQALFTAVVNERSAALKKSTKSPAATIRRLEECASAVRWLVERSVTRLNRKVVKPLFAHLLQTIVHQGRLLNPVALDYVKALRVLLSFPPHMEHLDTDQWIKIISLSFSAVLGDNLRTNIEEDAAEKSENEDEAKSPSPTEEGPSRKRRKITKNEASGSGPPRTVSLEQVEFTALIALLLRSSGSPCLSPDHPALATAILNRLCRFFVIFPSDTSAHLDVISAINSILDLLALNARSKVIDFGIRVWDHLLALWGTKNKQMKEGIIIALMTLFPYVNHTEAVFDKIEGIGRLFRTLHNEHDFRWGIESLSLDSMRLEILSGDAHAFETSTFRYGFNFTASQALTWVGLELYAECVKELFHLSESNHSGTPGPKRLDARRQKFENPMSTLLHSIQTSHTPHTRVAYLQRLLFVIDHHWSVFHVELQTEIVNTLLQLVTLDDPLAQSWTFLCFAALAQVHVSNPENQDIIQWDSIWSHTMRRTNVPHVCRAACHAARSLLISHKLPTHRILTEIEAMAQDINVQGPIAPYDSVCSFLAECIKVATQDVRLYKMQLEEKVLGWLTENWNALEGTGKDVGQGGGPSRPRIEQRTVQDVFSLLESICGLNKHGNLLCEIALPPCAIVDAVKSHGRSKVIREFLLYARLPAIHRRAPSTYKPSINTPNEDPGDNSEKELSQPTSRERKTSAFLLKVLDALTSFWESREETFRPQAEVVRRSIDLAVLGISFESSLIVNDIRLNRRVLLAGCKLIQLLSPMLRSMPWSAEEAGFILLGFVPLTADSIEDALENGWTALIEPGKYTGVQRNVLYPDTLPQGPSERGNEVARRRLQKAIWQNSDVQDVFTSTFTILKSVLDSFTPASLNSHQNLSDAMAVDGDADDFDPIRTVRATPRPANNVQHTTELNAHVQRLSSSIIDILAIAPVLQSSDGQCPRDKFLSDLVCKCDDERFVTLGHPFLRHVQNGHVYMSSSTLSKLLNRFEGLLMSYACSRSEGILVLGIHLLMASTGVWLQRQSLDPEISDNVRQLCQWFSGMLGQGKILSWRIRDHLVRFYDFYLSLDPKQAFLTSRSANSEDEEEELDVDSTPDRLLPTISKDEDIRVRFTVSISCARLLSSSYVDDKDPMVVYDIMSEYLCRRLSDYENMLTRLLLLGNVMIASSAARRGPYWHMLETCFYSPVYIPHIDNILSNVADRMGLAHHAELFQAYASQLAYSIRKSHQDFFRFPPHLLGYHDRKECARETFLAFSPTNLLSGGQDKEAIEHGKESFTMHCRMIDKTTAEGLQHCFSQVVGYLIAFHFDDYADQLGEGMSLSTDQSGGLLSRLHELFNPLGPSSEFEAMLGRNADGVAVSILKTLGESRYDHNGPIVKTLGSFDQSGKVSGVFCTLMKYRQATDFAMHMPNIPAFSTQTVLHSLQWLHDHVEQRNPPATTYHVLHQIFGEITASPLINEQLRLLHGLCLWISIHHTHFRAGALLRVLCNGASVLLAQPDLFSTAQGILQWTFGHYRDTQYDDPHLPDVLIRVCSVAQCYIQEGYKHANLRDIGNCIMDWIEQQTLELSHATAIRRRLTSALAAWPRQLTGKLATLCSSLDCEDLSGILGDHRLTSHKFKLVRPLADIASHSEYSRNQFAKIDFWRIKDSIPEGDISEEELDSFSHMLLLNAGQIRSNITDLSHQRNIATQHQRLSHSKEEKGKKAGPTSPKQSIITALLDMLSSSRSETVHVAYMTLRQLAAVQALDSPDFGSWSAEYRSDISYLNIFSLPSDRIRAVQISSLLDPDSMSVCSQFPRWISIVTVLLSDVLATQDAFYGSLTSVLKRDEAFAEQMLPVLVHGVLYIESTARLKMDARATLSTYFSGVLADQKADPRCLRSIVQTALHLRHFQPDSTADALAHNRWLDVDLLLLSRSAITCGAYTTALLFLELSVDGDPQHVDRDTLTEQILFDIYEHIDEPDGFYGIRTRDLRGFLLRRFHHEQQWDRAFNFHGAAFEAGDMLSGGAEGILQSLHSFGFDQLAMSTLNSMPSNGSVTSYGSSGLRYELGWRTEIWDLPEIHGDKHPNATLYSALRAIHRGRDTVVIDNAIQNALLSEMHHLRSLGTEDLVGIRRVNRHIMSLAQTKRWRQNVLRSISTAKDLKLTEEQWQELSGMNLDLDFQDLENISASRLSIVRSIRHREQRDQIGMMLSSSTQALIELEKRCLVQLSAAARGAHQSQIALNSIVRAQRLEEGQTFNVSEEYANVLWLHREQKLAVQTLKTLIDGHKPSHSQTNEFQGRVRNAFVLSRLGEWISEACLEKPDAIQNNYFGPAISLLSDGISLAANQEGNKVSGAATVFYKFALFAEQQYHAIVKSPDLIRLQVYTARKKQELKEREESIKKVSVKSSRYHELSQYQRRAKALYEQDTAQFSGATKAKDTFLNQAVEMLSFCLESSDVHDDDAAIRLCSLWFSNFPYETLNTTISQALVRIPSRKFVFLAHQLSARLSGTESNRMSKSQQCLQALLLRMCKEHPFHSLYQVYSLRSSGGSSDSRRQSARLEAQSASQIERATAAADIFNRLETDPDCSQRVKDVQLLCDAYLEWAKFPIKEDPKINDKTKKKGPAPIPASLSIRKITQLKVPVTTAHTPIDPTLRYEDCVWIKGYAEHYETAGGVNLPKISYCQGSDGSQYKQLFKGEGEDDLRQDAVMEQVFELCNTVLRKDRETRRRELSIRSYKVVPLAAQAGLLEFVVNTIPMHNWLHMAHLRYRPKDITPRDCINLMASAARNGRDTETLVKTFQEIRQKFKPVMRHFFLERHRTPLRWFEMRLKYSRSVATTSIIGHVLGLGDRHISNILLDNVSGEVVHIDLGIAFEQGKLLPVPEKVPFRLTADIVDGFGISGTEGVFRRCAEETLRVLRDGSDVIKTVLEVFKYDPLHSWTASAVKIRRAQGTSEAVAHQQTYETDRLGIGIDMESGTDEEAADRALNGVARKLDKSLSVEYTVNDLISEATDITNLATLFVGWSPYC